MELKAAGISRRPGAGPVLRDAHGRSVSYLRLSVTDRCNLRCLYCAPHTGELPFIPHNQILRYEEFLRFIRLIRVCGVRKLRLTGGEPFIRKGFMDFVRCLRREFPDLFLGITTNATALLPHVQELRRLGLNSLNISLDSLKAESFARITGQDCFALVKEALRQAIDSGLRVKINAVGLRGINDNELADFIGFAVKYPVDFRIIEHMPLGGRGLWREENFWPAQRILEEAGALVRLSPVPGAAEGSEAPGGAPDEGSGGEPDRMRGGALDGPARLYDIAGGVGRFGVITPVSAHFCASCNRLRLTADGRLRPCLFSDQEYDLRSLLRDGSKEDADIQALLKEAIRQKPIGAELLAARARRESAIERRMSSIGG